MIKKIFPVLLIVIYPIGILSNPYQGVKQDINSYFESSFKHKKEFRNTYIFMRTIQSPIYSLPLERSSVPLHGYTMPEGYYGSLIMIPFVQDAAINIYDPNFLFGSKEVGGFLVKARASICNFWMDVSTAYSSIETSFKSDPTNLYEQRFDTTAILTTIGAESWINELWYLNIKWLLGSSVKRLANNNFLLRNDLAIDLPHLGTGIGSDHLYKCYQNNHTLLNLEASARWLYFIKRNLRDKPVLLKMTDRDDNDLVKTTPGSFIDLLFSFYWLFGCDSQHNLRLGYNGTFNIGTDSAMITGIPEPSFEKVHFLNSQFATQHTIYGSYKYEFTINTTVFSLGLGMAYTFAEMEKSKTLAWLLLTKDF